MNKRKKVEYAVVVIILVIGYGFLLAFATVRINNWRIQKSIEYLYEAKKAENNSDKLVLLEQAAILNPSEETYLLAGTTALKLGDSRLAEKYLYRVRTSEGHLQLANAYYNLEKYDTAAINYKRSNNITKSDEAYLGAAKSYLKLGDLMNAETVLREAYGFHKTNEIKLLLDLFPDYGAVLNQANIRMNIYNRLIALGYPQSAKAILNQALENKQLNRESLILIANQEIANDEYRKAYDFLQQARTIDPYYPQIYKQLAEVCNKLQLKDEAKQYNEFYNQITF